MKPEDQRIAIAKVCGLDPPYFFNTKGRWVVKTRTWTIPDYLNDLNAMHEAETCEAIKKVGYAHYLHSLAFVCGASRTGALIFSTASQRAEAFLRTLNLWTD